MSLLSHIEDEIRDLSYSDLKTIDKIVQECLDEYKKQPSYSIPNYSFEEP